MYSHYVVLLCWAEQDSEDVAVLGVTHTLADAKAIFAEHVAEEKKHAEDKGFTIETNTDYVFEAYESGYYVINHTRLYIQGVY